MSAPARHVRTTELLADVLASARGEEIALGDVLDPIGERAFGFVILLLALPNFIPVPIGVGGPIGVFVAIAGFQMACGLARPWLPSRLRARSVRRGTIERFVARLTPVLRWIERLSRPRLETLTRQPVHRITGLLLVLIGVALALPIPFTNYLFGILLVVYAVALIERDGIALIVAWLASIGIAIALLTLSQAAVDTVRDLL
jgi:hypothetical protein